MRFGSVGSLLLLLQSIWLKNDCFICAQVVEERQGEPINNNNNNGEENVHVPPAPTLHRSADKDDETNTNNISIHSPPRIATTTTMDTTQASAKNDDNENAQDVAASSLRSTQKLSAIFPAASLPENAKETWHEHLAEQFKTFRTADVEEDSLGTVDKNHNAAPPKLDDNDDDKLRSTERQWNNGRDVRFQGDFAFSGDDTVLDERTLLDVFGEAAKEFLTQRVIPPTDQQCRWDWRSVRCEPACECTLEGQWGDYHLGRACRLRDEIDPTCTPVDPAQIWQDKPATRRVLSLISQTSDILRQKVARGVNDFMSRAARRFSKMQHHQCDDLWKLYHDHQAASQTCLPSALVPHRSVTQRILCGPVDFHVCDQEHSGSSKAEAAGWTTGFAERPIKGG